MSEDDIIPVPRRLLEDILDDVIECYNTELNKKYDRSLRHKNVLREYEREINSINLLLRTGVPIP